MDNKNQIDFHIYAGIYILLNEYLKYISIVYIIKTESKKQQRDTNN